MCPPTNRTESAITAIPLSRARPRAPEKPRRAAVRLLDRDPDLGLAVPADQRPAAANAAVAPAFRHACGPWRFFPEPDHASLGALILEGLIVVRIEVEGRGHIELLGAGDLISPWIGMGPDLALPTAVTASVVSELRLVVLDRGFTLRTARWPQIHAALMQRLLARARRLSLQSAINGLPRVEERLDLTFWQLGYRFGRVRPDGLSLQLRLTHSLLAEVVGAQRPSVTVALARLAEQGRIVREGKDRWLLRGSPPGRFTSLTEMSGVQQYGSQSRHTAAEVA